MSDKILLVERNKTICKNKNIAKIMNNHFINKTSKSKSDEKNNDIMKIFLDTFTFCSVLLGDVQKFLSLSKSVLATSLKQFMDFYLLYLTNSVNYSIFLEYISTWSKSFCNNFFVQNNRYTKERKL